MKIIMIWIPEIYSCTAWSFHLSQHNKPNQ